MQGVSPAMRPLLLRRLLLWLLLRLLWLLPVSMCPALMPHMPPWAVKPRPHGMFTKLLPCPVTATPRALFKPCCCCCRCIRRLLWGLLTAWSAAALLLAP
jgi:hypothetical protein